MNTQSSEMNTHTKKRWTILSIVVLSVFMSTLDGSIVNVALPTMAKSLNVTSGAIAWAVSVYLIAVSATMLLFGRLGDIWGKTNVFLFGIALFTIGSFLCGITYSLPILLIARIIQAVGAAGMMANSQGIITHVFPAQERGRALGVTGTFVALGSLAGPSLGGIIVSYTSWEYIFWINVPVGIIVLILGLKLLPRGDRKVDEKLDIPGAFLIVTTISLLFGTLGQIGSMGFGSPVILTFLAVTILLFIVFLKIENKTDMPLLELKLFRNKWFSISIICSFISFIAIFCSNIVMPFYLQDILPFTPGQAGAFLSIYPLILALTAPISGFLSDKIGSEVLTLCGLSLISLGLFLMSTLTEHPSYIAMGIFVAIMSLGNGLFQSPNTSLVMSTLPVNKLGIGGGINAFVRNLGMICGITLANTLLYGCMSNQLGYRVTDFVEGRNDVFIYGMKVVYLTAAGICLIGAAITAFRLFSRKREQGK